MALVTQGELIRRLAGQNRVLQLEPGEILSPSARAYLAAHRVELKRKLGEDLPKAEHMTHLRAGELVEKTHPRIRFRGMIDALEAEILLTQRVCADEKRMELVGLLEETLGFVRHAIRWDVLGEPVGAWTLCGYTPDQLREHSHHPEQYYGQKHFMASWEDGGALLWLNRVRTLVRQTELCAYHALPEREDVFLALNRLSSLFWILMIRVKAGGLKG